MEYLFEFLLFLAEAITIVVAIVIVISFIASMGMRNRAAPNGHLEVRKLNDFFEDLEDTIVSLSLSPAAMKKRYKDRGKADKQKAKSDATPKRVFVIDFDGDVEAKAADNLRHEITGILAAGEAGDTVVVRLESPGGVVHGYGFAASQLLRIKESPLTLRIAVDKVAASGGYLMACIADELVAAPFALVGSIGVAIELPNVNRLLKKYHVDVELLTAGEHKRTLTTLGPNTDEGRLKLQSEIDQVHELFKGFVKEHRPQLDLAKVATGEAWHGSQAIDMALVDRLLTSDQLLQEHAADADILEVRWVQPKKPLERFVAQAASLAAWVRSTALFGRWF